MTTVNTPDGVEYFRLANLKQQLKLEKLGMRSRGGAIRPRIAKEFGLNPRAPHASYIEIVEQRMEALRTKLQAAQGQPQ